MHKAKITKVNNDKTFLIEIPSLKLKDLVAWAISPKGSVSPYEVGDLVIANETNTREWLILGCIYK